MAEAYQQEVIVYYADRLTGPWSASVAYTIPPLAEGEGYVAYAGKAHPELARADDEIVFTFNVNARDEQVAADLSIYHPQFVRLRVVADVDQAAGEL